MYVAKADDVVRGAGNTELQQDHAPVASAR
jgi:hypothetical protein